MKVGGGGGSGWAPGMAPVSLSVDRRRKPLGALEALQRVGGDRGGGGARVPKR